MHCVVEKNNGEGGLEDRRGEGDTGGSSPYHPPWGSTPYHTFYRAQDLVYEIWVQQKAFVSRCIVPRELRGHCGTVAAALSIHTLTYNYSVILATYFYWILEVTDAGATRLWFYVKVVANMNYDGLFSPHWKILRVSTDTARWSPYIAYLRIAYW